MPATHALQSGTTQAAIDTIARWPDDLPLAAWVAGPDRRWTVLATPESRRVARNAADLADLFTPPPAPRARPEHGPDTPQFRACRLLILPYHLAFVLEPAAGACPPGGELAIALDCPGLLVHDRFTGLWHRLGEADGLPDPERLRENPAPSFRVGPLTSTPGRDGYLAMVRRALDAIGAGDVYQVNLAHRLSARFEGSTRACFAALAHAADPLLGVYAELPGGAAICSASPELFLHYDPISRRVRTRPMKGTRPISADPDELRRAEKDRAELNMITDLMRNDLGRVCEFGSVRVEAQRTIEAHAGSVYQATATVSGRLRDVRSPADLIAAAFPPGSVTGTPKVRAMQIIHELEPTPRGFYCGALGVLDDTGAMSLNVAIRTAAILPAPSRELHYHTGAGIVADSDPESEWEETMHKAEVLRRALGA
jgi:para-aminobenzoate synthetase component 1